MERLAATPAVYRARYDYETPVPRPANNASNAVLKEAELQTHNKAAVYKAYLLLRAKFINSFVQEDIIALSVGRFGVGTRSALDLYNNAVMQYQDDFSFSAIISQLKTAKSATQTYAALASTHCDLHSTLVQAGQPISELEKCSYLIEALNKDAAGMYAAQLYSQSFPLIHTRVFNGLVAHINLHARNAILTTGSMQYASAVVVAPVPALGASDTAALHAEIAKLKRNFKTSKNPRRLHAPSTIAGCMALVFTLEPNAL